MAVLSHGSVHCNPTLKHQERLTTKVSQYNSPSVSGTDFSSIQFAHLAIHRPDLTALQGSRPPDSCSSSSPESSVGDSPGIPVPNAARGALNRALGGAWIGLKFYDPGLRHRYVLHKTQKWFRTNTTVRFQSNRAVHQVSMFHHFLLLQRLDRHHFHFAK